MMPRTRRSSLNSRDSRACCEGQLVEAARDRQCQVRSRRSTACWATGRSWHAWRAARAWPGGLPPPPRYCRCEAPCAMAQTFTAAAPSALNTFADTPGVPAMPSPTTARIASSREVSTLWIWPSSSSREESRAHHPLGPLRLVRRNGAADGMLGAALRNQDHRNAFLAQRAEQAGARCPAHRSCPRLRC